jgi:hypothetical protein
MKANKIDAIARELKRIAKHHDGLLLPQDVVEEARHASSVLHSRFEWDNNEASERYRIWQARQLIAVCVERLPGVTAPVDVFVSLSSDRYDKGGYRAVAEVVRDEDMRAEMLSDALSELEIFQLKYRRLKELIVVFKAIGKVRKK